MVFSWLSNVLRIATWFSSILPFCCCWRLLRKVKAGPLQCHLVSVGIRHAFRHCPLANFSRCKVTHSLGGKCALGHHTGEPVCAYGPGFVPHRAQIWDKFKRTWNRCHGGDIHFFVSFLSALCAYRDSFCVLRTTCVCVCVWVSALSLV